MRALSIQHLIPTTLMNDASRMINATTANLAPGKFRHEMLLFIVGISFPQQLSHIIQLIIKTSISWNHMASFIILDQTSGCENDMIYFFIAWRFDLVNAKVMCS